MASERVLNIKLLAQDEATAVFKELSAEADKMAKAFTEASDSASKAFSTIQSAVEEASKATVSSMENAMKSMSKSSEENAKLAESFTSSSDKISESVSRLESTIQSSSDGIIRAYQETLKAAVESADKQSEAYTKLSDSITAASDKIGSALDKIQQSTEETNNAAKLMEAQFAGDTIKNAGEQVMGFFDKAISSAVDFDQAVVNTAASLQSNLPEGTKLAGDSIEQLRRRALELGQSGFFSANQIAEAMNTLAKQGIDYQTIMGGAINTVSQVAAANQEDLESTANVVADIIHEMGDELRKEFGPDLKAQMTGIGDAMTSALHHARISMDDFLNTMKYVGPQASAMGVSIKETSAAIALLGEHGIRGSQAGTTLRRMLTNLIPVSKDAAAEMEKLGIITKDGSNIFFDAHGKMKSMVEIQQILHDKLKGLSDAEQEHALKVIFGQYALSGMTAIARTAPEEFEKLAQSMGKTGVTAELVTEKSKGWGIQVQQLKAHFETFLKEIGERMKPVVESVMGVLQGLMNAWDHLSPSIKNALIAFGAATGVFMTVGGAIVGIIATLGMLDAALTTFAGVSLATVGVWAGVAAGIVAGVVLIVTHWNQLKDWVQQHFGISIPAVWNQLKTIATQVFTAIRDVFDTVWNAIKNIVVSTWNYIEPTIIGAIKRIQSFWEDVWPRLKEIFEAVFIFMVTFLSPILAQIGTIIVGALGFIKGAWHDAWNLVKDVVKTVWDAITGIISVAWDIISGIIKVALDVFTGHWDDAWKHIQQAAHDIWEDIKKFFGNLGQNLYNIGKDIVLGIAHGIEGAIDSVISAAKKVVNAITSIFSSAPKAPAVSNPVVQNAPPAFAEGGIVDKPQIALVGEGGEREYIIPEHKMLNGGFIGNFYFPGLSNLSNQSSSVPITSPRMSGGTQIGQITININGANKNGQQIGQEIIATIRNQVRFAL